MGRNSGFTLTELMVIIAIMAVLAAIAMPNLVSWRPAQRLQSAALDIRSAVQFARMAAVKENSDVVVSFDPGRNEYTVFVDDGAGANEGNGVQDADERTLRAGRIPSGVHITSVTPAADLSFNSRGLLNAQHTISLRNSRNESKSIRVNLAGGSKIL